jgi:hypothetical protein
MSNIHNDAKEAVADAKSAITNARRHLVARFMLWLRAHPHTMLVITAAAVILAVTFGVIRG